MTTAGLRGWAWVHRWSSLVSTLFLLVLCVTGLPLLFGEQIEAALSPTPAPHDLAAGAPRAGLDPMVATARRLHPGEVVTGIFLDPDAPVVEVHTAISHAVANADPGALHTLKFDAGTGALLTRPAPRNDTANRVNQFVFALHSRLLLGWPGLLLMGAMGACFVIALVSGAVLYAPFMRRLPFGTVRRDRSARVRWLDWHNLLSGVVLAWALIVGTTGVLNELNDPLFAHWAQHIVAREATAHSGGTARQLASVQAALDVARRARPDLRFTGIDYPGGTLNSNRHYMLWGRGNMPATAQIYTPIMVDAGNDRLTAVLPMPWYLRAIELSRPFHFGDYGGLPLKLIWALFDLATIGVLVTGLLLWWRPRKGAA